jgi:methyl-accepting chemotaxis protein
MRVDPALPTSSPALNFSRDAHRGQDPLLASTAGSARVGARIGIRFKLLLAFAAIAGLTFVATGVAFLSYNIVGGSLQKIEKESLPRMTHAFVLARQAAELVAVISRIAAADNGEDLAWANALLARTRDAMRANLEDLAKTEIGRNRVDKLLQEAARIDDIARRLAISVGERFRMRARKMQLVAGAITAHRKLAEKTAPLVDDASFNLIMGLHSAGDSADREKVKADLDRLADREAMILEGLSELRVESNLLLGILTEISLAPSLEQLPPLRDRLLTAEERARKAIAKLAKTEQAGDLKAALESLLAFADDRSGISNQRGGELRAIEEGWKLVAASKQESTALTEDVEYAAREAREEMSRAVFGSSDSISKSKFQLLGIILVSVLALVVVWAFIGRNIIRRLRRLDAAIGGLAGGDLSVEVPQGGRDELSAMARAVETFKTNAIEKARLQIETENSRRDGEVERNSREAEKAEEARRLQVVINSLGEGLAKLSAGDLVFRIERPFEGNIDKLRDDFNTSVEKLQKAMLTIAGSTRSIRAGTGEIAAAADDIALRTQQQTATLEETATALDEITATINNAAGGADRARKVVSSAKLDAESSGQVMRQAIEAMSGIERSSQQIAQIIGVIDEIAFQTNMLALNAGIEAARAGEAGRGFAVVASEVRALAHRTAAAAKEIKDLISMSTVQVEQGVDLIAHAGEALTRILAEVAEINTVVADIANGAREQATGLQGINTAVNQMNEGTQQNAVVVEESVAGVHALAKETDELAQLVGQFQVGSQARSVAEIAKRAARSQKQCTRPAPIAAVAMA